MLTKRFLQTKFWTEFKAAHGWKSAYFFIHDDNSVEKIPDEQSLTNERSLGKQTSDSNANERSVVENTNLRTVVSSVLVRTFSLAKLFRFSLAYIPMAPEKKDGLEGDALISDTAKNLSEIAQNLKPYLPKDTMFIRFDPPVDFYTPEERDTFAEKLNSYSKTHSLPLRRSPVCVQPPDTTILNLKKTEEDILSGMKNKWRYNIRLAAKKGVEVSRHFGNDADFEEAFNHFYTLFQQTSERDGVSFHGKDYYIDLLKRGVPSNADSSEPVITLYLAKHEEDYLAGIITLFYYGEAVYLYGASGNIKRNLMPAYLLQWTAIQDAKAYGCPCYDFYGMPPAADENHPMHGLYLFKTGFGGQNTHRPGSFDVPLKKSYSLYSAMEKLRAWWFKKAVKKFHGR